MPIPTTRADLTDAFGAAAAKLRETLAEAGPSVGSTPCVDAWTIKDLLLVRAWWTERVVEWIEAGRRGERPETPAPGYTWRQTPALNDATVRAGRRTAYRRVRERLDRGIDRAAATIDALDDRELLEAGVFDWAGRYPVARWLSINTTRQYVTARTLVRRALRS